MNSTTDSQNSTTNGNKNPKLTIFSADPGSNPTYHKAEYILTRSEVEEHGNFWATQNNVAGHFIGDLNGMAEGTGKRY